MEQLNFTLYDACRKDFVIPENSLNLETTNVEVKRIRKLDVINKFLNSFHYLHSGSNEKS